jgi:phosphoglycerate dehydrogenase-like enzyme
VNVLYLYPINAEDLANLRRQLSPDVVLMVPSVFLDADGAMVGDSSVDLHDVQDQISEADVFVSNWADPVMLAQATRLQAFVIPYAGVPNRIQAPLQQFPHITVYNCHFNAVPVAEHAWALLLAVAKRILECDQALRRGDWTPRYEGFASTLLRGKTAGIVGYGAVGHAIAEIARGFGMHVLAIRRRPVDGDPDFVGDMTRLDELLVQSDVVFVCLPLTAETRGLIGEGAFRKMKPSAIVVNVARGSVVDEAAFYYALREGRIRGAGIDTWYVYPRAPEERLHTAPSRYPFGELANVVLSPHRATAVEEAEHLRVSCLADVLNRLARGETPLRAVDLARGY